MLHVILLLLRLLLPLLAPEVCMVAEELLHGQCCHADTVTLCSVPGPGQVAAGVSSQDDLHHLSGHTSDTPSTVI